MNVTDFQVYRVRKRGQKTTGWCVSLPHQCQEWDIAGTDYDGVPHEQAIAELEAFIAQAVEALAALREQRELNDPNGGE